MEGTAVTNPLPKNLALAQLRLRSITAGLDLPLSDAFALTYDVDGENHTVTLARYAHVGADPRHQTFHIRELVALARIESDHPARAPIADPPTRLSAPPPSEARALAGMTEQVFKIMSDGAWWTLEGVQDALEKAGLHHGLPAISARLRDLRKAEFGGHLVHRERVPGVQRLYRYRVQPRMAQ
jgi:hypothetical protein